jgi:hypothetical protein
VCMGGWVGGRDLAGKCRGLYKAVTKLCADFSMSYGIGVKAAVASMATTTSRGAVGRAVGCAQHGTRCAVDLDTPCCCALPPHLRPVDRAACVSANCCSVCARVWHAGTCILFGDGCGAVLLSAAPEGASCSLLGVDMHSDGNGQKSLHAMYSGCGGKPFHVSD